jgi:phospholipid/cholesterol/gamma-HCH transport system substrate-binding protein
MMCKIDTLLSAVTVLVTNPSITNSLYNVQSLTQNVQSASKALPEMMSHFDMMSDNLYNMSSGLSSASGQVTYVMDDAKDMMANLKSASQSVENLCVDMNGKVPNILNSVNDIGTNLSLTTEKLKEAELDQLISNLNVSVNNLNSLTASLNDIMNNQESTLGKILYDPDVYNKLDSTLENASKLLEDLKSHPKRYVHFSLFGKKDK